MFGIINKMNDFLWSWGVSIPIILFGVVATIAFRVPWARMFKHLLKAFRSKPENEGACVQHWVDRWGMETWWVWPPVWPPEAPAPCSGCG